MGLKMLKSSTKDISAASETELSVHHNLKTPLSAYDQIDREKSVTDVLEKERKKCYSSVFLRDEQPIELTVADYPTSSKMTVKLFDEETYERVASIEQNSSNVKKLLPNKKKLPEETSSKRNISLTPRSRFLFYNKLQTTRVKSRTSLKRSPVPRSPLENGPGISQILFPITTRKKSMNRKKIQLDRNISEQSDEIASEFKLSAEETGTESAYFIEVKSFTGNKQYLNEENEVEDDKLSILPLNSAKQAKLWLNNHVTDSKMGSCLQTPLVNRFGDVESPANRDENNNTSNDCKSVRLTTMNSSISNKKKGVHRVSFSNLPPVEIKVKQQQPVANPDEIPLMLTTERNELSTISPSQISTVGTSEKKTGDRDVEENVAKIHTGTNEIDETNELLMDIIEELEAGNISLDRCLHDLVSVDLITQQKAKAVSVTYDSWCKTFKGSSEVGLPESEVSDVDEERSVEELLDILTSLGLEKLSRCRNCILSRLCQLPTYEDYETAQKAAADARGLSLSNLTDDAMLTDEVSFHCGETGFTEKSSAQRRLSSRSHSTEDCEFSATESDDDIYLIRQHFGQYRHRSVKTEDVTANEQQNHEAKKDLKDSKPNQQQPADNILNKNTFNLLRILTILTDEGILKPKQVWQVLSAKDENEQKEKLKSQLTGLNKNDLVRLYEVPGLKSLRLIMKCGNLEDEPKHTSSCLRQLEASDNNRSQRKVAGDSEKCTCICITGSHGQINFLEEETTSEAVKYVEENTSLFYGLKRLMIYMNTSVEQMPQYFKTLKLFLPTNLTNIAEDNDLYLSSELNKREVANQAASDSTTKGDALEEWCRRNNLPHQIAVALRENNHIDPSYLWELSEEEIENLTNLSWLLKAKLWVTIKGLKLDLFYKKSQSELSSILEFLET